MNPFTELPPPLTYELGFLQVYFWIIYCLEVLIFVSLAKDSGCEAWEYNCLAISSKGLLCIQKFENHFYTLFTRQSSISGSQRAA